MNKKMIIKTVIAFTMIAVVLPEFWFGGMPLHILMTILAVMAASEIASLFDQKMDYLRTAVNAAAILLLAYIPEYLTVAVIAGWMMLLCAFTLFDENFSEDRVAYSFLLTMFVGIAINCVNRIYVLHTAPAGEGFMIMMYLGCACFGCDTGAYFFGVFLGKHKMIPRISPNKTWEGAVGGYLTGVAMSLAWGLFMIHELPTEMIITASLTLPIAAQIGDLSFSAVKRRFEVKDFSSIFPGHGGVLDRVDSMIFCLIVFCGYMVAWGI